jgi:pimeloyl-ACP methyl ester carboxylesterase
MNPFSYANKISVFNLHLVRQNGHWRQYAVDFPVAFPDTFQDSNTAYGEYFQPVGVDRAPLAILIHGWGDRSALPMHLMARRLARKGIASFLLYLPFHSRRLPDEMKSRRFDLKEAEWFAGYRIGVSDISQIVDWAETMKEIDHEKVAVIGLSLGGFIGSIAMGIDERIKAGVLIVTGGNSAKISRYNRVGGVWKRHQMTAEQYEQYEADYLPYLEAVSKQGWENVQPERIYFLIDPLTYAHRLRERKLLMINARWDEFIPTEATLDLWKALGECQIMWLPATHASIWLWYPLIASRAYKFLTSAFGTVT